MLLSDRFTYIHEPKTGGTFVTHVLTQVHGALVDVRPTRTRGPLMRRLGLGGLAFHAERGVGRRRGGKYGVLYNWNDHGTAREIPAGWRARPILGTIRNPFETYVSLYRFGWWRRADAEARYRSLVPDFDRRFPRYPELTFAQFMALLGSERTADVGYLSERFVNYYFRHPRQTLQRMSDSSLANGAYRKDMYDVRFVHTANLNDELVDILLKLGYDDEDVAFIRTAKHVVPTGGTKVAFIDRAKSGDWADLYDAELVAEVRRADKLLFTLFPELLAEEPA